MSTLFLCGAGNSEGVRLAMVCNNHERRWDNIHVLDDDPSRHGSDLIGVPIIGGFDVLASADPENDQVANLVARTTAGRAAARKKIASYGIPFTSLVHPGVDTFYAELADEVTVYHNTTIGPESRLEMGCVVFMGAVIGHESHAAEGCVIAANSVLNARVQLGERVYVGTNSTILPEITVGDDATIAAGSVVIRNIDSGDTVIGVPADSLSSMTGAGNGQEAVESISMGSAELTRVVTDIWCKLLGIQSMESSANFFDLGGNSVLAIHMQDQVGKAAGVRLGTTDVFRFPTIKTLVIHLCGSEDNAAIIGKDRAEARKMARNRKLARVTASVG